MVVGSDGPLWSLPTWPVLWFCEACPFTTLWGKCHLCWEVTFVLFPGSTLRHESKYIFVNKFAPVDWLWLSVSANKLETKPTIPKLKNIWQRWHEFSSPLASHMHYKMVWMKGYFLHAHAQQTLHTKENFQNTESPIFYLQEAKGKHQSVRVMTGLSQPCRTHILWQPQIHYNMKSTTVSLEKGNYQLQPVIFTYLKISITTLKKKQGKNRACIKETFS